MHVTNPAGFGMQIERDAAQCENCHQRGDASQVVVKDGFIDHHEQYGDLSQGKHSILDCVDCHNPHTGVNQLRQEGLQTTRTQCTDCHWEQATYQKNATHLGMNVACVECHMPRLIKTASGDAERFTGDFRTHRMVINPNQIDQFSTTTADDGTETQVALPEIGLNFACRHCHGAGLGTPKTDEELIAAATGYHDRPAAP
jgi:formate-dependent nitrite reductase cytochrome c552 subunit